MRRQRVEYNIIKLLLYFTPKIQRKVSLVSRREEQYSDSLELDGGSSKHCFNTIKFRLSC